MNWFRRPISSLAVPDIRFVLLSKHHPDVEDKVYDGLMEAMLERSDADYAAGRYRTVRNREDAEALLAEISARIDARTARRRNRFGRLNLRNPHPLMVAWRRWSGLRSR
jgi:hypothetical protein